MMSPFDDEWRDLGFYCHHDTLGRQYRLIGSRVGLLRFAAVLRAYAADPKNQQQSEHDHVGPFGLEIMTWPEAGIDDHAIRGPATKLANLADIVEDRLEGATPGQQLRIREEFAATAEFTLVLDVRCDDFDPGGAGREIYLSTG